MHDELLNDVSNATATSRRRATVGKSTASRMEMWELSRATYYYAWLVMSKVAVKRARKSSTANSKTCSGQSVLCVGNGTGNTQPSLSVEHRRLALDIQND